jgi:hypothetical protein
LLLLRDDFDFDWLIEKRTKEQPLSIHKNRKVHSRVSLSFQQLKHRTMQMNWQHERQRNYKWTHCMSVEQEREREIDISEKEDWSFHIVNVIEIYLCWTLCTILDIGW